MSLPGALLSGQVFAHRYVVESVIGSGGNGVVYAAHDRELKRRVAVKVLRSNRALSPTTEARFRREVLICAQLTSERIAKVFDVGNEPGVGPYFVLELLEGIDLGRVVSTQGPVRIDVAAQWILQACEPLAEAHATWIVHRDIKPSNLFLSSVGGTPLVKVLDFGIARFVEDTEDLTISGTTVGTPRYMAPEQFMASRDIDARADIWSLGVTLYELLTGAPIFDGVVGAAFGALVLTAAPIPLRVRLPSAPQELEALVARCLEKNREHRFASVLDLAQALAPFARDQTGLVSRIQGRLSQTASTLSSLPPAGPPTAPGHVDMAPSATMHPPPPGAMQSLAPPAPQPAPDLGTRSALAGTAPPPRAPSSTGRVLAGALGGIALAGLGVGAYQLYLGAWQIPSVNATTSTPDASPAAAAPTTSLPLAVPSVSPGPVSQPTSVAPLKRDAAAPASPAGPRPTPPPVETDGCRSSTGSVDRQVCGGECVHIDDAHCVSCRPCAAPNHCQRRPDGRTWACAPCPDGLSYCAQSCVNLQTSAGHCGRCLNLCTQGRLCINGTCSKL